MKRAFAILFLAGFHTPATFDDTVQNGGGNRIYFTGSPRQKGYDCSICHTDAPRTIRAQVALDPPAAGAYVPGTAYTVAVAMLGEHAGFGTANNQNGFVAEVVDDAGRPAGALAGDAVDLVAGGTAVAGMAKNTTSWTFSWTAPANGGGPVTLHLGMLDGNGAASAAIPETDPGGDDVAVVALRLCEGAPGCADLPPRAQTDSAAAGCSAGAGSAWLVAVVLALAVFRRRIALVVLAGCFDPTLPGECPDHVCGGSNGADASTCRENWVCTSWEAPPGSDVAARTCTDVAGAGTTDCKPSEGPVTLPALDLEMYKCAVHPIFQRGCGQMACHGTDTTHPFRIYTRGRWRNNETVADRGSCLEPAGTPENLQTTGSGTVMCEGWYPHTAAEWKKSFDSTRSFMLDVTTPDDSLVLREVVAGGLPHAGIKLFRTGDADYTTIQRWLGGARLGTTCNTGSN